MVFHTLVVMNGVSQRWLPNLQIPRIVMYVVSLKRRRLKRGVCFLVLKVVLSSVVNRHVSSHKRLQDELSTMTLARECVCDPRLETHPQRLLKRPSDDLVDVLLGRLHSADQRQYCDHEARFH